MSLDGMLPGRVERGRERERGRDASAQAGREPGELTINGQQNFWKAVLPRTGDST